MFGPIIASCSLDYKIIDKDNIQFKNNDIHFKYPEEGFDFVLGLPLGF